MTEKECADRIGELRMARNVYEYVHKDPTSSMFNCFLIKELIKRTNLEISRLEELIYNSELDDSLGRESE